VQSLAASAGRVLSVKVAVPSRFDCNALRTLAPDAHAPVSKSLRRMSQLRRGILYMYCLDTPPTPEETHGKASVPQTCRLCSAMLPDTAKPNRCGFASHVQRIPVLCKRLAPSVACSVLRLLEVLRHAILYEAVGSFEKFVGCMRVHCRIGGCTYTILPV